MFFLGTAGCTVKYIDSVTIFEIKGQIYDNESHLPIENVTVYFMDTGYDYVRSKKPYLIEIGQSDADGKISARLNYLWRHIDSEIQAPPNETFDILLSKERYEQQRFHFDKSRLQRDGMLFVADLDKVYMLPKNDAKK